MDITPILDNIQTVALQWVSSDYPKPLYHLSINGLPFGPKSAERLISLSVRDCRGFEADQLDIELSDHDGLLEFPSQDDVINVWLGFDGSGLEYKGEYKVSEYSHSGAPDVLKITARAADLAATLAESKEKSWHKTTVYDIVSSIAAVHDYQAKISDVFKSEKIDHIDQTSESDASFLTRLADQYDAIATVKGGILLFIVAGEATTASGQPMPLARITRVDGDRHTYSQSDTENYQAVKAFYRQLKKGQKAFVVVNKDNVDPKPQAKKKGKKQPKTSTTPPIDTGGQKVKVLRHLYANKSNAERGARTAFKKIKRAVAEFKLTLAIGRPELTTETPVIVSRFKPQIDRELWLIKELLHKLDSGGLTTDISLEMKLHLDEGEGDENSLDSGTEI